MVKWWDGQIENHGESSYLICKSEANRSRKKIVFIKNKKIYLFIYFLGTPSPDDICR